MRLILGLWALAALCYAQPQQSALAQAEVLINAENFTAAEKVLERAIINDPNSVEMLYRLGYVRYRQRKLVAARSSFETAVKLSPTASYSRYFLGQISLLENKPEEAIKWLRPVVEGPELVFDASARLAAAYTQGGKIAEAEQSLRQAISQTPWDGSLYYRLGQLQKRQGKRSLAEEAFAQSSRLKQASREDVEILMQVSADLRSRKYSEALAVGEQISQRANPDPVTLVALGVLYGGADRHEQALRIFDKAAERNPQLFEAQLNRGLALLRTGQVSSASEALRAAVALLPQSPEATRALGLSLFMQQRYKDAIPPLEQAWSLDPSNSRTAAVLGTSYLRTGAAAKAVEILKVVVSKVEDPALTLLLADAQTAAQDNKGALATTSSGRQRFVKVPEMHVANAQVLIRLGQYNEARPAFEYALGLRPDWAEAHLGLADCLQKAGEHEAALFHYQKAAADSTAGNVATALAGRVGLARSLLALRRLDQARSELEQTVAAYPAEISPRVELARVYARLGRNDLAADQTKIADQLRARQGQ